MPSLLAAAIEALNCGGLVVFPTETVYGLGADAANPESVAKIFAVKGRPRENPLIIHCHSLNLARTIADFNPTAMKLAEHFLPGPLTIVLPLKKTAAIAAQAVAELKTVAIRLPSHPLAAELLRGFGRAVAAPSANVSGRLSPTAAAAAPTTLAADVVLDGGNCRLGIESTIIDLSDTPPRVLRPGSVTIDELEPFAPGLKPIGAGAGVKAPGMLARHYAPSKPLRLNALSFAADEAVLGFGDCRLGGICRRNLSPKGDLAAAAANLYTMLGQLEATDCARIAVSPIPNLGVGVAINNRLKRAVGGGDA